MRVVYTNHIHERKSVPFRSLGVHISLISIEHFSSFFVGFTGKGVNSESNKSRRNFFAHPTRGIVSVIMCVDKVEYVCVMACVLWRVCMRV